MKTLIALTLLAGSLSMTASALADDTTPAPTSTAPVTTPTTTAAPASSPAKTAKKRLYLTVDVRVTLRNLPVAATLELIDGGKPVRFTVGDPGGGPGVIGEVKDVLGGRIVRRLRTPANGRLLVPWPRYGNLWLRATIRDHGKPVTLCAKRIETSRFFPPFVPDGTRNTYGVSFGF